MPKTKLQKRKEAQWRSLFSRLEDHHSSWGSLDALHREVNSQNNGSWMKNRYVQVLAERERLWEEFREIPDDWIENYAVGRSLKEGEASFLDQEIARRRSERFEKSMQVTATSPRRPRM